MENNKPKTLKDKETVESSLVHNEKGIWEIIDILPEIIYETDTEGNITFVNKAGLNTFGYTQEDIKKGINGFDLFVSLDKENAKINRQRLIESKGSIKSEYLAKKKDGSLIPIIVHAIPVFKENNFVGTRGIILDITDRKNFEKELKESHDFLNTTINSMQEPLFVKDEQHRWVILNDASVKMWGYTREYLLGKSDFDVFPKEQAEVFWEKDDFVFKNGNNVNVEKITDRNGEIRTIVTSKVLYKDELTGKSYIVGTIHDITEIQKAEQALRQSEEKYKHIMELSQDGIAVIDMDRNILLVNERLTEMIGYSQKEMLGTNLFDYIYEEDKLSSKLLDTQSGSLKGSGNKFRFRKKDGKELWVLMSGTYINEFKGDPSEILCVFTNITALISYENKLELYSKELNEMNKSKDKFFSIISHNLKSPFTGILGFSEILCDNIDNLSMEEIKEYLNDIRKSTKNVYSFIDNLLRWSGLQIGRLDYQPIKIDLYAETQDTINLFKSHATTKKIKIKNHIEKGSYAIGDKNMINSVLQNLLSNAVKFTHIGGEVKIESISYENHIEISVIDNGTGIAKKDLNNIFKLDIQYSKEGTANESGTGLGLLLCKEMIEKNKGVLTVESEAGKGSIFKFTLPKNY